MNKQVMHDGQPHDDVSLSLAWPHVHPHKHPLLKQHVAAGLLQLHTPSSTQPVAATLWIIVSSLVCVVISDAMALMLWLDGIT
jgi:hypothetical protein